MATSAASTAVDGAAISVVVDDQLPPLSPLELSAAREIWWSQVALGYRLPAERDVILISSGRR